MLNLVKCAILLITIQKVLSETSLSASNKCLLPNNAQLENMIFKLHPRNETIELGSYVESYETVYIECKNQYPVRGEQNLLCENGKWNNEFPACDGYCDGNILNTLSLSAICDFDNTFGRCPKQIAPGTIIIVKCAYGYTRNSNTPRNITCLPDGSFDKIPECCEMSCGKVASDSKSLSKHGVDIAHSKAPWHVAIYENKSDIYNYVCSGSIVSPTIVVSAAHCFWDESTKILKSYQDYQIIAGRTTANYSTEQNEFSQVALVQEIYISKEYQGRDGRQEADIAFLKLAIPLKFSENIAPICLSKNLKSSAATYMTSGRNGFINSFIPLDELERSNVITLDYHACSEKTPVNAPIPNDQFCIYSTDGALVCRGDSGGGFYLKYQDPDTYEITYKLWGVISNTPTTKNDCMRLGDKSYVAIANIFNSPSDFAQKLANARMEEESLF